MELTLTPAGPTKSTSRGEQGSLFDTWEVEDTRTTDTPESLTLGFVACFECYKIDSCNLRKRGAMPLGCNIIK